MRFVLYNIRYGTGEKCPRLPWSGYLRRTGTNLARITAFIRELNPDVLGLVEVDAGSFRAGRQNQARLIAEELGHYHIYASKYRQGGLLQQLPLLRDQGNAFVVRDRPCREQFHYFRRGVKRLIIELELDSLIIFLVHLSLRYRVRQYQLHALQSLIPKLGKPCILAGDFNAFWGEREIEAFLVETGLRNPNVESLPSYPSWRPKRHLDFILHSPGVRVNEFHVPRVTFSDHLPLVLDFEVTVPVSPE